MAKRATKEECVQAAIGRIRNWCQSTSCEIPETAWVTIKQELETMFDCLPPGSFRYKHIGKMKPLPFPLENWEK